MFDMTVADPVLREVILPGVREFLNHATVILKYAERRTQDNPNGEIIVVYHKQGDNNAGTGAAEFADVVAPFSQKFGRSTIPSKHLYKRVRWTGKVIAATRSDKGALIDAIMSETEFGVKDFKTSINRQLNGDGRDTMGFYVSGAGGATVVVTDQWGNVGGDYFRPGTTVVDLINGADNSIRQAGLTATRGPIVATGRQLTVSPALSGAAVAGDYFVLNTAFSATAVSQQLMGIRGIISNVDPPLGDLQGVDSSTETTWQATVVVASGATTEPATIAGWVDLKWEALQRVLSELNQVSDEGEEGVDLILTSYPGLDSYIKAAKDERISVNQMKLDGGFSGVSFNSRLAVVPDKHFRRGAYFFPNFSHLNIYQLADLDWADRHGSMFEKIPNKDGYESMLYQYAEFATDMRNAHGALVGVNMIY